MKHMSMALMLAVCFLPAVFATTVLVNSQDYQEIISASVYAAAEGDSFAFSIDPRQAVFITRYYSSIKTEPIIYLEGKRSVLPNMATLLRESGLSNLTVIQDHPIQEWVADQFPRNQAIIVGGAYGQDALSAAPYAAVSKSPLFFIDDPARSQATLQTVRSRGYGKVMIYGPLARQLSQADLDSLPNLRTIDTGSRYSNNIEIAGEFLKLKKTRQVMFVSGKSFEKSIVDVKYPVILVGRSSVPQTLVSFLTDQNISSGVVFSGDSDIVDGVARIRALNPNISVFIKFGEGYSGGSQEYNQVQPLMIKPLPSPKIEVSMLNISYNVAARQFEIRVANSGDFVFISTSVFVKDIGAAESSQIAMGSGLTTSLGVGLDATRAIANGRIPSADVTASFGEDSGLADNVETVTFMDIPLSSYMDNSSVRLVGITYSSEKKAFVLQMEGEGWVSGTVRFVLRERPFVLDVPLTYIKGSGKAEVKFLLSADEEKYAQGLKSDYLLRYGAREDVLLKEERGQKEFVVLAPSPIFSAGTNNGPGLSLPMICAGAAVVLAALVGIRYYLGRREGGFD